MTTTMPIGVDPASGGRGRIREQLASSELRRMIERFVRRRVRSEEVEDVVQTVLCDALAAERPPEGDEELRRWVVGIARHKVADLHRRGGRERLGVPPEQSEPAPPIEERAMVGWAEKQTAGTADGRQTLDWLAREGEGEKLAAIADDARLPAAQVRQRVSRLRRLLRGRWMAELAAVAAVALLVVAVWRLARTEGPDRDAIVPEPPSALVPREHSPAERAETLRAEATKQCASEHWQRCVELLDEAAALDPAGDQRPAAQELREQAAKATAPAPEPTDLQKGPRKQEPAPTVPTSRTELTPQQPEPQQQAPTVPKETSPAPQTTSTSSPTSAPTSTSQAPTKPAPTTTQTPTSPPAPTSTWDGFKGKGGKSDWTGNSSSLK